MSRTFLTWLHGLGAAFIGGGSGAVSAAFGVNIVDPKDWNMADWQHSRHMLFLMAIVFLIQGALTAFAWLSKSPLPPLDAETAAVVHDQAVQIQASAQKIQAVTEVPPEGKP